MTKQFETRVKTELTVDTRTYRYIYECYADCAEIKRIRIEYLDTTMPLTEWETVKVYR